MTLAVVDYWQREILPSALASWQRLDIPPWENYRPALQEFTSDAWKASQSAAHLSYLTFRPLAILCWMILEVLWDAAQVLFRILLSQGWVQAKKAFVQLRTAAIWFYRFQMSLSRTELLGEAALILLCIGLYYAYKWVQRQTYWQRFVKWLTVKKRLAIELTTRFVNRVALVSSILAMAIPHTAFIGAYAGIKLLFPSLVKWLAHDTYTTALLSIWYPLVMTLSWVHETRDSTRSVTKKSAMQEKPESTTSTQSIRSPPYNRPIATIKPKERASEIGRRRVSSAFSRTNPPKPETPVKMTSKNTSDGSYRLQSPAVSLMNETRAATHYWLRYWVVFALVQSLGAFGTMVPVFGSFLARHPYVLYLCSELKLLFFIWLFAMEKIIGAAVVEENSLMASTMPLALIHENITPLLLEFEAVVSEAVSMDTWMSLVHSKVRRVLEVVVMLKMLSEERKEWLLHIVEESRTLLLPSLSLFMPSFITSFGVAYVQFVVPSAKSARVLRAGKQSNRSTSEMKEDKELLCLQYWVIHCLVSGLLAYFSGILWWIPFSTHTIFILWCHFSLPKSICQSYSVLETELIAFGLLPGDSDLALHETRTAQLFHALFSRLPSAVEESEGKKESAGEGLDEDTERCERRDKLTSANTIGKVSSVDSQDTNVEVSLRSEPRKENLSFRKVISVDSQDTNVEISLRTVPREENSYKQIFCDDSKETESEAADENVPPFDQSKGKMHNFKKPKPVDAEYSDEDDNNWLPPSKPCGSSITADSTNEFGSEDSSVESMLARKDDATMPTLRRSTRQRRKIKT